MAKILVVDDEAVYCEQLRMILTRLGHEVRATESGAAAVHIDRTFCCDLLLIDWMLKEPASGLEIANTLRTANPEAAAIMITGYPVDQLVDQAGETEGIRFLQKPFGADALREAVAKALGA